MDISIEVLHFHDGRVWNRAENKPDEFGISIRIIINGVERKRTTGPYITKDDYKKVKLNAATAFDSIDAKGIDNITIKKIKLETAKRRAWQVIESIPEDKLTADTVCNVIDYGLKTHPLLFSEPKMSFDSEAMIKKVFKGIGQMQAEVVTIEPEAVAEQVMQPVSRLAAHNPAPPIMTIIPIESTPVLPEEAPQENQNAIAMIEHMMMQPGADIQALTQLLATVKQKNVVSYSQNIAKVPGQVKPLKSMDEVLNSDPERLKRGILSNMVSGMMNNTEDGDVILEAEKFNPWGNYLEYLVTSVNKEVSMTTESTYERIAKLFETYFNRERVVEYRGEEGEEKKPFLAFCNITATRLKRMEAWMLKNKYSWHTIKTYMGYACAAFNKAKEEGIITVKFHPFGDKEGKYAIPIPPKKDRSIDSQVLTMLFDYKPDTNLSYGGWSEEKALDFWTISLLAYGINPIDLLKLTKEQFNEGSFEFERSKTIKKKRKKQVVTVLITPVLKTLLEKWAMPDVKTGYIFPTLILTKEDKARLEKEQAKATNKAESDRIYRRLLHKIQQEKVKAFTTQINRYMARIVLNLNKQYMEAHPGEKKSPLNVKVTSYTARHTFANQALKSGMNPLTLMLKMGQSSLESLLHYVNGSTTDVELKAIAQIVDHMQKKAGDPLRVEVIDPHTPPKGKRMVEALEEDVD